MPMPARPVLRGIALIALAVLSAALMITGPMGTTASATTVSVATEAEFRQALTDLSGDSSGAHTIEITHSFEWVSTNPEAFPPLYNGTQALTINGNGHTISFGSEAFGSLLLYGGSEPLTINELEVAGFDDEGVLSVSTTADVTIIDSTFSDNGQAEGFSGGVIAADDSTVTIENSVFDSNAASNGGVVDAAAMTVTDSQFRRNTATGNGGAIVGYGQVRIADSVFAGNEALVDGGAVFSYSAIEAVGSHFEANLAYADGGALASSGGAITVDTSTFLRNEAAITDGELPGERGNGGAIFADDYEILIDRSTFSANVARLGGAVSSTRDHGGINASRSTFVSNIATVSGGAGHTGGSVVTDYSTYSANEAASSGAHFFAPISGSITPEATVFVDAVGSDGCYVEGGVPSGGMNFDDDGTCSLSGSGTDGDFGLDGDALLGSLADNGGPTHTMLPAADSPLVDVIPSADCTTDTDQRGVDRPAGGACDVGAVETLADLSFTISTDDGDIAGTVKGAECVQDVSWHPASDYPGTPADLSVPFGVSAFSFCVPGDGWTVDVELDLPRPVTSLWKVTDAGWDEIGGAAFDGTVVSYSIVAGGPLDESSDSTVIEDPVAPGVLGTFTG